MKKQLILLILLMTSQCVIASEINDDNWIKVRDENNIQVYTVEQAGTDIIKAKAVALIHASLEKIQQKLDDIDARPEWIPYLKYSKIISQQSPAERIEYSLFSAPWPASDRDFVYQLNRIQHLNAENQRVDNRVYQMHSVVSELVPEEVRLIRGEIFESVYSLTAVDKELTRVELTYHADPKGWLPTWIINIIQRAFPYRMMENLKQKMEKSDQ